MIFFWKIVPNWVYFGQGEDFKLTTELSEKVQYFCNQAIKNGLRLVFTSDGVVIRSVKRYDLVKIKPTESEAEH